MHLQTVDKNREVFELKPSLMTNAIFVVAALLTGFLTVMGVVSSANRAATEQSLSCVRSQPGKGFCMLRSRSWFSNETERIDLEGLQGADVNAEASPPKLDFHGMRNNFEIPVRNGGMDKAEELAGHIRALKPPSELGSVHYKQGYPFPLEAAFLLPASALMTLVFLVGIRSTRIRFSRPDDQLEIHRRALFLNERQTIPLGAIDQVRVRERERDDAQMKEGWLSREWWPAASRYRATSYRIELVLGDGDVVALTRPFGSNRDDYYDKLAAEIRHYLGLEAQEAAANDPSDAQDEGPVHEWS